MAKPKDKEMPRCPECGRLFLPKPGQDRCKQCMPAASRIEPHKHERFRFIRMLAERLGLAPESVAEVAKNPELEIENLTPPAPPCKACGDRPSMEGSDFCFECRVASFQLLGEAMKDVGSRMQKTIPRFGKTHGTAREALEGRHEVSPVPENKTPTIVQLRGNQ